MGRRGRVACCELRVLCLLGGCSLPAIHGDCDSLVQAGDIGRTGAALEHTLANASDAPLLLVEVDYPPDDCFSSDSVFAAGYRFVQFVVGHRFLLVVVGQANIASFIP